MTGLRPDQNEALPTSLDMRIQGLVRDIASTDDFARTESELPRDAWKMLSVFAGRMASLAVRDQSVTEIRAGLIAAKLASILTDDFREVLPAISLLYRASDLIGVDSSREFLAAAELAGNPPDGPLARFLERSSAKKGIERMGFAEGADESGFRFLYVG